MEANILLSPIALADLETAIYRQVKKVLFEESMTMEKPAIDDLMTVDEAAKFLSIAVPTLYGYIYRKQVPSMKRRGRLYFSRAELTDWLKQSRRPTAAEIREAAKESLKR